MNARAHFFLRSLLIIGSASGSVWFVYNPSLERWGALILGIAIAWVAFTVLTKRTLKWSLVNYALTPILLWGGALSVVLFTPQGFYQMLIIGITSLLSLIWATTLTYHVTSSDAFVFRGNLLSYLNGFIMFFTASALYAGVIFIPLSSLVVFTAFPLLTLILFAHILRASHLTWNAIRLHVVLLTLLVTELFGALMFIPTSFWVKGFLITASFYIVAGISRCALTSVLTPVIVRRYLVWGGVIIFGILITAPWQ